MSHTTSRRPTGALIALAAAAVLVALAGFDATVGAQGRGGRGGGGGQAQGGRGTAPIDLTGNWVSIISEDWRLRMVTPRKGDYLNVPLNQEGRRVADLWDPDLDEREQRECSPYGAPGVMRLPTRLRITWQDDTTLRIDTDAGQQTRLIHFGQAPPVPRQRSWQGHSVAQWEVLAGLAARDPRGQPTQIGGNVAAGRITSGGSMRVVTSNLRAGYLRRNGVPYSENAVLTEWFDRHTDLGAEWILHTRIVEDPLYLTEPYVVTSHFKQEPDGSKWSPRPCEVIRPTQF